MRLLVTTQAVDENDPVLGFFVRWIEELATRTESIEVICLYEGTHQLPENVRVHSLGKERGRRHAFRYALSYLAHVWRLRNSYDAVFVHMNEEYVLVAGILWKLLGKRVYLWRNHYAGSWRTHLAAVLTTKVFYTSKHSYTARFANEQRMPVGVDLDRFTATNTAPAHSILFLARMAPAKRPDMLLDALIILKKENVPFSATFIGNPSRGDESFYERLCARGEEMLPGQIQFLPGIPHDEAASYFASHALFVNASASGMFDKTMFEAAASGCLVVAASDDFAAASQGALTFRDVRSLARVLGDTLTAPESVQTRLKESQAAFAQGHALPHLADRLVTVMTAV